jgi:disulfide bond formation protein DsbB
MAIDQQHTDPLSWLRTHFFSPRRQIIAEGGRKAELFGSRRALQTLFNSRPKPVAGRLFWDNHFRLAMPLLRLSTRSSFVLAALACALLLGYGYYLEHVVGLQPCPLCLVQRGFFYAVMAVGIVAALHGRWPRLYGILAALFATGGAATASRQVWLQHLPPDKVPQCGPDLFFMLDNFPLSRTLKTLVSGTGECAAVDWTFLGLSIAEWSLLWFAVLTIYLAGISIWRTSGRWPPASSAAQPPR